MMFTYFSWSEDGWIVGGQLHCFHYYCGNTATILHFFFCWSIIWLHVGRNQGQCLHLLLISSRKDSYLYLSRIFFFLIAYWYSWPKYSVQNLFLGSFLILCWYFALQLHLESRTKYWQSIKNNLRNKFWTENLGQLCRYMIFVYLSYILCYASQLNMCIEIGKKKF